MKVVIPTAGAGTRLRPHTFSAPKPLMNVAGRPVLAHVLDQFQGLDVEELVLIIGHLGEQIVEYVQQNYAFPVRFVRQEQLLGQAHALYLAREHLSGPIVTAFVDTITAFDLHDAANIDADGIVYLKEVADPRRFGVAVVQDQQVRRLIEKPDTMEHCLALVGVYYFAEGERLVQAIESLMAQGKRTKGEYYLSDAVQVMIDDGARFLARGVDIWEDCGQQDAVLATNRFLLARGHGNALEVKTEDAIVVAPSYVAPGARIRRSVIGPNVTIAEGCEIADSIIEDTIVERGCTLRNVILSGSLIGPEVNLSGVRQQVNLGHTSSMAFRID